MYKKLNITENHIQALVLFTNGFYTDYYIREVQKLLGISPRTAQLVLEKLETKGILESKTRGKIKSYTLKKNSTSQRYLTFAEQYKALTFFERNHLLNEVLDKIRPFIKGIGVIFGSYAKGTATKDSDIDLFIAGTHDAEKIKQISKTYKIEISIKCYPQKTFEKGIRTDFLTKEILKNHIIFFGAEDFMQAVLN